MATRATPDPATLLRIIALQSEIAGARLDLENVLQIVVQQAAELTEAAGSVVELVEGDEMVYRAVAGTAKGALGMRLKARGSMSGLCVSERSPMRCDDSEVDPRVDRVACRRIGLRSMICVPLFEGNTAVGVLKVSSPHAADFDERQVMTLELLARIIATSIQHARRFEAAMHDSTHDALTGLGNRRSLEERLALELGRFRRYGHPMCFVAMDLDGFKLANDRWGHAMGDTVLEEVARILQRETRASDGCFRTGGDEFCIVMPDTPLAGATGAVERIKAAVATAALAHGTVGVSAGISTAKGQSADDLVAEADAELYREKRAKKAAR